jgi:hypothetical protein
MEMKTTLRDFGDGQTIVVHTNDRELASKLSGSKFCFNEIPYEQIQKNKAILVGVDYYFPKSQTKALMRKLGIPPQTLKRNEILTKEDFSEVKI